MTRRAIKEVLRDLRAIFTRPPSNRECLHVVNDRAIMETMDSSTDRTVLVPMRQLDDLLELARLASDRLPETDSLRTSLAGAVGAVRYSATAEP